MNRKKIIFKNGFTGLLSQMVSQVLQFIIRIFILRYIGIEIMGISATLTSVLQTLSLTELGFQSAVVYYLYAPLKIHDEYQINCIMTILKRVYTMIGFVFIGLTIVCIPLLPYILKNVSITGTVVGYYILMSFNMASTYFMAYKRTLLFADQKEYISKVVDGIFNIISGLLKLFVIGCFKNYTLFLILSIMQTIGSNIVIHFFCMKKYKYLHTCKFDFSMFKIISKDVKNVFVGRIAGYVYGGTDNLVISSFLGTVYVGYLSNYMIFIMAFKQIIDSIFYAMTPIIGNMMVENKSNKQKESGFRMYSYVRYILASIITIPFILLISDVVKILFGKQYILSEIIVILMAIDLYIHMVYTPCVEYINGSGYFDIDRNIAMSGAVLNVVVSVYLVFHIGIEGVLIGTALSQIFFWVGRSSIVYFKIFKLKVKEYFKYILKNILWLAIMVIQIFLITYIKSKILTRIDILVIILLFIICEVTNGVVQLLLLHFSEEQRTLFALIKRK